MKPRTPLPPSLVGRPFTASEAGEHGLTRRMLQGSRFRRLGRDVYVSADLALDHALLCTAACLADPEAVLSHASAVLADTLPLGVRETPPALPHVTSPVGGPVTDRSSVVCHVERVPPWQIVRTACGPSTSPARTFVDRAAELCLEDTVALGDQILRRGLADRDELAAAVEWAFGRRGVVRAREALPLLDPRAASVMESWVRVILAVAGLPAPELNVDVFDEDGGWLANGDLVWRRAKLIVEYDGEVHLSERQRRVDAQRRNQLFAEGWTVLTFTADDVLRRPWALIALVRQQLDLAAAA